MKFIPLPSLARELEAMTGLTPPRYRALYERVLDGALPAEQIRGRWFLKRRDLPRIAARLGLIGAAPRTRRT